MEWGGGGSTYMYNFIENHNKFYTQIFNDLKLVNFYSTLIRGRMKNRQSSSVVELLHNVNNRGLKILP